MEIKDINLEEYEISEQKDKEIIVLKKKKSKYPTWEGLGNISGVFIGVGSKFFKASGVPVSNNNRNIFLTEKHAKSALAMAQISQLMPYYGGGVTAGEWGDSTVTKYILHVFKNKVIKEITCDRKEFLAFRTAEQRDEFLKDNEQLVKDYLMIE